MYWQICSWTGVMPSSGNSFYQSSSHLLSFDNGTGCWHGAGSWDSPPLYASGTCQRWKCSLFFSITMENGNVGWASRLGSNPCLEHVVNCQGMGGLASSFVAAAVLRMGIQSDASMPPWPARGKLQACAFLHGGPWKRRGRSVAPRPDQL